MALKRFVNGADGEFFFQKRAPESRPDWIETVELSFPSGRTADEIVLSDAAAAGLDRQPRLHRPQSASGARGRPRPPRRAARRSRPGSRAWRGTHDPARWRSSPARCSTTIGLVGWPKTSGSRGIHINVRIEPRWTFDRGAPCGAGTCARGGAPRARRWPPASGGRRSATASSSTTTRTPRTAPWPPRTRFDRCPTRGCRCRSTWDAGARRGAGRLHAGHGPGASTPATATRTPASTGASGSLDALLELSARHEAEGLGDAPWPPNYGSRRASRRASSRRASAATPAITTRRGKDGSPPPEVVAPRAPPSPPATPRRPAHRWQGSVPSPTGRRRSRRSGDGDRAGPDEGRGATPVSSAGRPATRRPPPPGAGRRPRDAMRGRSNAWYRLRLNLTARAGGCARRRSALDPDAAPDDGSNLSDDERAAWLAGRRPGRRADP